MPCGIMFALSVEHLAVDGGVDRRDEDGDAEFHSARQAAGIDQSEDVVRNEAFVIRTSRTCLWHRIHVTLFTRSRSVKSEAS